MEVEDGLKGQLEKAKDEEEASTESPEHESLTLNSLHIHYGFKYATMRVQGTTGHRTLHILIDMGSSHNFLSNSFFKQYARSIKNLKPM